MTCVVCGAEHPRRKLRKGETDIWQCGACGLAWWNPEPGFSADQVYDAAYFGDAAAARGYDDYADLEPALRATFARRIARIERPGPGARLLDVGAAFGFAVSEAARAGWRAFGLEISRAAARRAGRTAAGRVVVAHALRLPFASRCVDAVTLWDVLEHLPDPHAALGEVARVLVPGGRLALTTGDVESAVARLSGARWHLYTLPEHLFFYSRRSLARLLDRHGLDVERQYTEPSIYPLGYLVERLRKTLLSRPGSGGGRFPGARLPVPVNLFDIVTVQAVRRAEPVPVRAGRGAEP